MFKKLKRRLGVVFNQIKLHKSITIANLAVVVSFGVLAYLIWIFGGGRVTFGPLNSYFFIWLSIIIAITAALNTIIASIIARNSLRVTQRSLELTRATTRPFFTLTKAEYNPHGPEVVLYICNTGALPGNKVLVEIFFLRQIGDKLPITGAIEYPLPSIFPNEEKILAAVSNPGMVNYINSGAEARIFVTIKYRSIEKECNTRRMFRWPTGREARQHHLRLEVLEENNYWD